MSSPATPTLTSPLSSGRRPAYPRTSGRRGIRYNRSHPECPGAWRIPNDSREHPDRAHRIHTTHRRKVAAQQPGSDTGRIRHVGEMMRLPGTTPRYHCHQTFDTIEGRTLPTTSFLPHRFTCETGKDTAPPTENRNATRWQHHTPGSHPHQPTPRLEHRQRRQPHAPKQPRRSIKATPATPKTSSRATSR